MSRSFAPVSLRPGGGGWFSPAFTRLVVCSSCHGAILALCRVELASEQLLCSGLTRDAALKRLGMWHMLFIAVLCFSLALSHPHHAQHRRQHRARITRRATHSFAHSMQPPYLSTCASRSCSLLPRQHISRLSACPVSTFCSSREAE